MKAGDKITVRCPACRETVGATLLNLSTFTRRIHRHGTIETGPCSGSAKFLTRRLRHDR